MIVAISTIKMIIHPDEGLVEKHYADGTIRKGSGYPDKDGYMRTRVSGKLKGVHRIIWEYVHGVIPEGQEVDHVNGIRHDNRIVNLRLVTHKQNLENRHRAQSNSKSSVKGVWWDNINGKWRTNIRHEGVSYYIGRFPTIEEAQTAYAGAAAFLHTHNPHAAP
jgi:hypothetical protein